MPASRRLVLALLSALAPVALASQQRTYANPIDIDYRYNFEQKNEGISYRSGADPVIVVQGGRTICSRRSATATGDQPIWAPGNTSRRRAGR